MGTEHWTYRASFDLPCDISGRTVRPTKATPGRFICATSTAAAAQMVRNNFASGKYETTPAIGVIIIKEEAAKDVETQIWGFIAGGCSHLVRNGYRDRRP